MYTPPMFNNIAMQLDTNWRIRYGQDAKPNRSPMENAAQKCCISAQTKYNPKLPKQNPSHPNGSEVRKMVHKTENSDVKTYFERMIFMLCFAKIYPMFKIASEFCISQCEFTTWG